MLQIKEYDLASLDSSLIDEIQIIDAQIKKDLEIIEKKADFKSFFEELIQVIDLKDFSFIKASSSQIEKLKNISTSKNISSLKPYNQKFRSLSLFLKKKKKYTLNDVLEFIFGYHLEKRTQILKKIIKQAKLQNCVYCLAQYTTSYGFENSKIFIKGNLDHIIPKSKNALISLSVNNLVPVCSHCNQRKLNANLIDFNFNPFDSNQIPIFKFEDVLEINKGEVKLKNLTDLKIENINPTLESRLELTSLYQEYKLQIENLLDRYKNFNSSSYIESIEKIFEKSNKKDLSYNLEYFISETPYTDENIQNIPLHKFKSDFYKELEEYKKIRKIAFS